MGSKSAAVGPKTLLGTYKKMRPPADAIPRRVKISWNNLGTTNKKVLARGRDLSIEVYE